MIIINYWNISAGYNYPYRHPFTLLDECTAQLGHQLLQSSDLIHKLPFGTADCFDNVRDIYYRILLSQLLIKCIIASILPLTFGCSNGSPSAAPRPLPACINCSGHSEAQTRLTFSRWRHRTVFFFFLHPFAELCVSSRGPAGNLDGWERASSFYPSTRIHPMRSDLSWRTALSSKYGKRCRLYVWTLFTCWTPWHLWCEGEVNSEDVPLSEVQRIEQTRPVSNVLLFPLTFQHFVAPLDICKL